MRGWEAGRREGCEARRPGCKKAEKLGSGEMIKPESWEDGKLGS